MLNDDFSRDLTWGSSGADLLSLDFDVSACSLSCTYFTAAKEQANGLALDPWRGRAYVIGERANGEPDDNDWLVGVIRASDRIFASNFAATSPND